MGKDYSFIKEKYRTSAPILSFEGMTIYSAPIVRTQLSPAQRLRAFAVMLNSPLILVPVLFREAWTGIRYEVLIKKDDE